PPSSSERDVSCSVNRIVTGIQKWPDGGRLRREAYRRKLRVIPGGPMRHRRTVLILAVLAGLASAMPFVAARPRPTKGKVSRGKVLPEVVAASVAESSAAPAMPQTGFAPQSRRGFTVGDQWEPAIAADGYGNVYVLYPQYLGVPGCA